VAPARSPKRARTRDLPVARARSVTRAQRERERADLLRRPRTANEVSRSSGLR